MNSKHSNEDLKQPLLNESSSSKPALINAATLLTLPTVNRQPSTVDIYNDNYIPEVERQENIEQSNSFSKLHQVDHSIITSSLFTTTRPSAAEYPVINKRNNIAIQQVDNVHSHGNFYSNTPSAASNLLIPARPSLYNESQSIELDHSNNTNYNDYNGDNNCEDNDYSGRLMSSDGCYSPKGPSPDRARPARMARLRVATRAMIGEFIATTLYFTLLLTIIAQGAHYNTNPADKMPIPGYFMQFLTAIVGGLLATAMIFTFGNISGAHFNPAITFASWLMRTTSNRRLIGYILAQLLGSITAMAITSAIVPDCFDIFDKLVLSPEHLGVHRATVFAMELVCTFILAFVALGLATEEQFNAEKCKKRSEATQIGSNLLSVDLHEDYVLTLYNTSNKASCSPFAVGITVVALVCAGGAVSGAAMNPARLLGPAIFARDFSDQYLYWIAEFVGAGAAALIIKYTYGLGIADYNNHSNLNAKGSAGSCNSKGNSRGDVVTSRSRGVGSAARGSCAAAMEAERSSAGGNLRQE
jgi:glycerol uptake facilitator-like aquaporin